MEEIKREIEFADVIYICRPNNPTGFLAPLEDIKHIAAYANKHTCEVVLDEAFLDFVDELESFISLLKEFPNVIVVRSMTKGVCNTRFKIGLCYCKRAYYTGYTFKNASLE